MILEGRLMPPADKTKSKPMAALPKPQSADRKLNRWRIADLTGEAREAIIEHDGQDYRLRVTANDKLILTK
jgi:hemin uptake protein HemP